VIGVEFFPKRGRLAAGSSFGMRQEHLTCALSANGSTRPEADFAPNLGKVGGAIGEIASFGWIATEEAAQEGSERPLR
jgi:hypothetical protein